MEEPQISYITPRHGRRSSISDPPTRVSAFRSGRVTPMSDLKPDDEDLEVELEDVIDLSEEELKDLEQEPTPNGVNGGFLLDSRPLLSLLMPALIVYPGVTGGESLSEKYEELLQKQQELWRAATHIDDAIKGRGTFGKRRAMTMPEFSKKCFALLDNQWWGRLILIIIIIHSVIGFFEPTQDSIKPGQMHQSLFVLEIVCISVYITDVFLHIKFYGMTNVWKSKEAKRVRVEFVFTVMFVIDCLMLMIQEIVKTRLLAPFRCLRPAMLYAKSRNFAHIFDVCASITLSLGKVVLLVCLYCLVFSAAGVHLYMDYYHYLNCDNRTGIAEEDLKNCEENGREVYTGAFDHVGIAFLRMFVLISSENYPAVMIPAYSLSNANFLFFGCFVYIGIFIVMSVLIARVVEKYWYYSRKHVKEERLSNRSQLAKAWIILDPDGQGNISDDDPRIRQVLLYIRPKLSSDEIDEIVDYIDEDTDGVIDAFEWTTRLSNAMQFDYIKEPGEWKVSTPQWLVRLSDMCRWIVTSTIFNIFILVLILSHSILTCIKWYGMSWTAILITQAFRTVICFLFLIEIIIKCVGLGSELKQTFEVLDLLCSSTGIVSNILWYLVPRVVSVPNQTAYHAILVVVSSGAIFCRLGFNSKPTKKIMESFLKILPVMFDLIMFVVILIYFYAMLGMELFYGFEPDYTLDSDHWGYGCDLGFATLGCSMLEVFQICTTSNWHEIMNTVMLATTDWSAVYFVTCFCIVDMIVMNLFVAITIEAFKYIATSESMDYALENPNLEQRTPFRIWILTLLQSAFATSRTVRESNRRKSLAAVNDYRRSVHLSMNKIERRVPNHKDGDLHLPIRVDIRRNSKDSFIRKISGASKSSGRKAALIRRRQEKAIKDRLTSRKYKAGNMVKVISAFRKSQDCEVDLHVGDEVEVLEKCGDYWKGLVRGKIGTFPASHVVEYPKRKPIGSESAAARNTMDDGQYLEHLEKETECTEDSQMGAKVKIRGGHGEWRTQILGDLTVMNPSEMLELNRIIQADRRSRPKSKTVNRNNTRGSQAAVTFDGGEESTRKSETDNQGTVEINEPTPVIQIHIDAPGATQGRRDELEHASQGNFSPNSLSVRKPTKEKNALSDNPGEAPEWVKQFMDKHNQKCPTVEYSS